MRTSRPEISAFKQANKLFTVILLVQISLTYGKISIKVKFDFIYFVLKSLKNKIAFLFKI